MVRAIITWSLHNRLIVLLATLGLVLVGLHSRGILMSKPIPIPPRHWSK